MGCLVPSVSVSLLAVAVEHRGQGGKGVGRAAAAGLDAGGLEGQRRPPTLLWTQSRARYCTRSRDLGHIRGECWPPYIDIL